MNGQASDSTHRHAAESLLRTAPARAESRKSAASRRQPQRTHAQPPSTAALPKTAFYLHVHAGTRFCVQEYIFSWPAGSVGTESAWVRKS